MIEDREKYAAALLHEREGYVLKGREDRVRQIDDELRRVGAKVPETTKASQPQERAVPPRPGR